MLRYAHDQLINADTASRQGDKFAEFEAYNHLGLYFEQEGLLPLAAYQYRRCLGVAEEIEWLDGQMATETALGLGMLHQLADQNSHFPSVLACKHALRFDVHATNAMQQAAITCSCSMRSSLFFISCSLQT
jgi:hypothetical protein